MKRRVVIVKDDVSPLWVIRCEKPCEGRSRWCMDMTPYKPDSEKEWGCWLSGYGTRPAAVTMAESFGYEVVEAG